MLPLITFFTAINDLRPVIILLSFGILVYNLLKWIGGARSALQPR